MFQQAAAKGTGAVLWTAVVWGLRRWGPVRRWRARKTRIEAERAKAAAALAAIEEQAKQEKLDADRTEVLARAKRLRKKVPVRVEGTSPVTIEYSNGEYLVCYNGFEARQRAIAKTPAVAMHSTYHLPKPRPVPVGEWSQAKVDKWFAENPEPAESV